MGFRLLNRGQAAECDLNVHPGRRQTSAGGKPRCFFGKRCAAWCAPRGVNCCLRHSIAETAAGVPGGGFPGLLGSTFKVDDFAESSAMGANLAISGWTNHSLRSHVGVEAVRTAGKLTPRLAVRWLHEFKDDRSLEARLAAVGGSYTAADRRAETDLAEVSLSVSGRLGKTATGYLSLGSTWGRRSHLTADLTAGVSWQF